MTLDGMIYKKGGSSSSSPDTTSSSKSGDTSSGDVPSDSEIASLLKNSFSDFTEAVSTDDFSDFYDHSSGDFKASYTKDETATTFKTFVDQKDKVLPSLRDVQSEKAKYSSPPSVRTEKGIKVLTADGEFPTSPNTVKFETDYELEKGEWKIVKFKVKM